MLNLLKKTLDSTNFTDFPNSGAIFLGGACGLAHRCCGSKEMLSKGMEI